MAVLRAARDVDPPDWLVGGGVLPDLVWDRLHDRAEPSRPRDVDLAFFDPRRLDAGRDAEVERALVARLPGVPWDAKNQAAVHRWYGRVFGAEVPRWPRPPMGSAPGRRRPPRSRCACWTATSCGWSLPAAWKTCSRWCAGAILVG